MAAAPNSTYVAMAPIQQQLWDKDLNVALAGGVVKFWSDASFTVAKNVYAQNQTSPFGFVSVGSTLTLSIIGTFVNPNNGNNFIPFMWPFQGNPATPPSPLVSEPYFIQVFNSGGTLQFTISDWPPNLTETPQTVGVSVVNVQQFTTPGLTTYTPHSGMQYCIIQILGGGGGGGGCAAAGANQVKMAGAGGAGGYSEGIFTAANIGVSQIVTIGAGGTGGAAGDNAGAAGGASSVGSLISALGGSQGLASPASATSIVFGGGAGANAGSGGYLNSPGLGGAIGFASFSPDVVVSGMPGSTAYGSGFQSSKSTPSASRGYGAGGGGASDSNAGGARAGADGRPGLAIITEYCTS